MEQIKSKWQLLTYCLLFTIVYHGIFYVFSPRQKTLLKTIIDTSITEPVSSEAFCHPPNSRSFRQDQLSRLVVSKMDERSAYLDASSASNIALVSQSYTNLTEFIHNVYTGLMSRRLIPAGQTIDLIFHHPPLRDMAKASCDGLWMEFGVFRGATITRIANWKRIFCGNTSEPVFGFDTFSGLPTDWRPGFGRGTFDVPSGTLSSLPSNVVLVKGLFINTLPIQLRSFDQAYKCKTPVSFVHIDCDIYDGARDVLFLLGSRLVSGSILVFDELFNYPGYEKHEIKALFELLAGSNLKLIPLGASSSITLNSTIDTYTQSFGFTVL